MLVFQLKMLFDRITTVTMVSGYCLLFPAKLANRSDHTAVVFDMPNLRAQKQPRNVRMMCLDVSCVGICALAQDRIHGMLGIYPAHSKNFTSAPFRAKK